MYTELFRMHPDARFMLIGDDPLRPDVEVVVAEHDLSDCVLFLGGHKGVPNLCQAMSMFPLPSLYEGLPMVGVEAQHAELSLVYFGEVTNETTVGEISSLPLDMSAPQ